MKGTVIPDIKTALKVALEKAKEVAPPQLPDDWDDEGDAAKIEEVSTTKENKMSTVTQTTAPSPAHSGKHLFQPTNNVSRETFNYVKRNPGIKRPAALDALVAQGFNASSVSSLFAQMLGQRMLFADAAGGLHAAINEHRPIKGYRAFIREKEAAAKQEKRTAAKTARKARAEARETPKVVEMPSLEEKKAALPVQPNTFKQEWSAQDALGGLSVLQARALYDELKKIFGA